MWSEKLNGAILPWQRGLGILTCAWRCVGSGGERRLLEEESTSERAREGGGTMGVDGGWSGGDSRWGGCPGRDFRSIGTLVVRMTGSSLLVEDEVDGGGRCGGDLLSAW